LGFPWETLEKQIPETYPKNAFDQSISQSGKSNIVLFFYRKKLKKEKDKGNKHNGETSPTDNDESGFDGWSDDLPTASKTNDDDWSTDTSADAVAQRMSKLGVGVKGLTHNQDLEKSTEERFQIFFKFVKVMS